ncbi:GNAT family N-acetyltransferase [Mastigocladopsis repens]|uniref:GNAT family N-acetyltransferase n=1 Tax=Mastigocladopsis repens TaxID=221287 RepID=UPI0004753837|nr:GNAT family N-acetyltransferase [Mastigocladopsis repens]
MSEELLPGYCIRRGSTLDKALLVKFMQRTYQEAFPQQDFSHLARTVEQYFSKETPVWWVDFVRVEEGRSGGVSKSHSPFPPPPPSSSSPIACLWVGNAIDQVRGDRHVHIFLLYVLPEHRRRGIGTALMRYIEDWARSRGDHQIGLQVFQTNTAAFNLYNQLHYQTHSLWMIKSLDDIGK